MCAVRRWPESITEALLDESTDDLYEHAPCGYVSLLPDGVLGRVNTTFAGWIGWRKEELVGQRRFLDLLTLGSRIYYETHFEPLLRMQGQVRAIAFDLTCQKGERLPVLVNATQRTYTLVGTITRITVFDATDRRKYERELLAARRRAEDESQAKADLVATLSHDIRAPLSAITTAIALLERSAPTPQQARYIRVLQSSASHAVSLVNNLLDLSRLEAGRRRLREEPFVLRELVNEIAAAARDAALEKPALEIRTSVDATIPDALVGDRAQLAQVLANLLANAVKFTALGFVALILHGRDTTAEQATFDVSVTDTGIGIPADRLPRIFDAYTQAGDDIAKNYGGTGLGLAISRRILRLHGSELEVTSTPGEGTTFSFALTLKRVQPPA